MIQISMALPVIQPSRVTVMIKPMGAVCNLDCHYCYYLPTMDLYDGQEKRMSRTTLEEVFASVLPRFEDRVTIAWQGGEPTLAGLDFFKQAIVFQEKYRRPDQRVEHALQTNATRLDDDWCRFLREHDFLVGVSVDGPPHLHDHYRLDRRGQGSSDAVLRGLRLLQKHRVEYNILCVLNDHNVEHPDEVLGYLLNLGAQHLQFIPAIEWDETGDEPMLRPFSPRGEAYGRFMCRVFDKWFDRYRRQLSIRFFDMVLNQLVYGRTPLCIMDAACHNQLTIEHDGAVFGCDHFVERRWQLGQIGDQTWENPVAVNGTQRVGVDTGALGRTRLSESGPCETESLNDAWLDRVDEQRLATFADRKQHLSAECDECRWKRYCFGGCPKNRPGRGDAAAPSVLCDGYQMFFEHAMPRLEWLAGFLRRGQLPPDPETVAVSAGRTGDKVGRNNPCPCGSGRKYKQCCGRQ